MSTIADRVTAGAAFLDEHEPAWLGSLHLGDLDLDNYEQCVLGQLYGTFGSGADRFELTDEATIALGFTATGDDAAHDFDWVKEEMPLLTAEWKRFITARREAPHA